MEKPEPQVDAPAAGDAGSPDAPPPPPPQPQPAVAPKLSPRGLIQACFSLKLPVSRGAYVLIGVSLMLVKFAIERWLFSAWVGRTLTPIGFLSPFFRERAELLHGARDGATWTLIALSLPFIWIGVSMSVRRALDAGLPPLLGFTFLIPGLSYLLMAALSVLPARAPRMKSPTEGAYRPAPGQPEPDLDPPSHALRVVRAVLLSSSIGLAMFGFCVYFLRSYGTALFIATPFVMGMAATYSYRSARGVNKNYRANTMAVGCGFLGLTVTGIALLMLGAEGLGCIAMAILPAGLVCLLGSLLAITIGALDSTLKSRAAIVLLPFAASAEAATQHAPLNEVVTSVVVDAPPEVVWERVTSFPDLAPPTELLFRAGISYPTRARIEGQGVGAIRYCEFSTGTFVEPVTTWDAPRRLAFDVAETPPPMQEFSFWDHVDAPHLHGFMKSEKGEFRLVALPGGKTRLEGSTYYTLEIFPSLYWKAWTDVIIHRIHLRVLNHIQKLAEADAHAP